MTYKGYNFRNIENPVVKGNWYDKLTGGYYEYPQPIGICCGCETPVFEDEHYEKNESGLFIHDNDRDCYKLWFKNQ